MPRSSAALLLVLAVLACGDSTGPAQDLAGAWDLVGYSDAGVAAVTTGDVIFEADGDFSIDGTIEFPGEPVESLTLSGTWSAQGDIVTLRSGSETGRWMVSGSGESVTLTLEGSQPATTMTLERQG